MAEIISRNNKKTMPRVDLTPMVDLGFLLITFFIVTHSLNQAKAMKLNLSADGESTNYAQSKTLNLVLDKDNKVVVYNGTDSLHSTAYSFNDKAALRNVIINKQMAVEKAFGMRNELLVLIKPSNEASYKNIVDALDEMLINNVTRYMVI